MYTLAKMVMYATNLMRRTCPDLAIGILPSALQDYTHPSIFLGSSQSNWCYEESALPFLLQKA